MREENLLSIEELAAAEQVSTKTQRTRLAEAEYDPDDYAQHSGAGRKTPLYSLNSWKLKFQELRDFNAVSSMSDKGKLKFMVGHIELEGTQEQRDAIRDYVDSQVKQALAAKEQQVLQLTSALEASYKECNELEEQAAQEHHDLKDAMKELATVKELARMPEKVRNSYFAKGISDGYEMVALERGRQIARMFK